MPLSAQIESFLFISPRPLTVKHLLTLTGAAPDALAQALAELLALYNTGKRGIRIVRNDDAYQMTTAPEYAEKIGAFIQEDTESDLTRPQLEALTVIAYRGPITKGALEQIRGVNCTLILRNLMIRGLVEEETEKHETRYRVTMNCLHTLGIQNLSELPEYATLHNAEELTRFFDEREKEAV